MQVVEVYKVNKKIPQHTPSVFVRVVIFFRAMAKRIYTSEL